MKKAVVLGLLALLPVALAGSLLGASSPVVAWTLRKGTSSPAVSYQVTSSDKSIGDLVLTALGKPTGCPHSALFAGGQHNAVVVYVGSQLDSAAIRKASNSGPLAELSSWVSSSEASLLLPNARFEGSAIQDSISQLLAAAGLNLQVEGCNGPVIDLPAAVRGALSSSTSRLDALLVCSQQDSIQGEIQEMAAVKAAVQEVSQHAVFVYASQPKQAQAAQQRRSLLSSSAAPNTTYKGFGNYTVCGPLCQTQVRWLEGMLAILFMALAACAGMTCLNLLDTPSRFETQKDAASGTSN